MRSAVADLLRSQHFLDVYEYVPSDVAAYPCLVIGRVTVTESPEGRTISDLNLDVYVCGRPQSDDAQDELDKHADAIWMVFGGTKQRKASGIVLACTRIVPSVIAIASTANVPAYVLTIESALVTC